MVSKDSGFAALMAILSLFMVGVAMAIAAALISGGIDATRSEQRRIHLAALNDAAIAEALAELSRNPSFSGHQRHAFGEGWIGSQIGGSGSDRTLSTVASWNGHKQKTEAIIVLESAGPRVLSWRRLPA